MEINEVLILRYPSANFRKDIILQDDGNGPYIKEWKLPYPRPTQKDLDDWAIESQTDYEKQQISLQRKAEYIKSGITTDALIVALWEKIVENRPEALDAIQAERMAIKAEYPAVEKASVK